MATKQKTVKYIIVHFLFNIHTERRNSSPDKNHRLSGTLKSIIETNGLLVSNGIKKASKN
jgi:hypothetical protein